jgi:REP element-mobilizing transposase RayT
MCPGRVETVPEVCRRRVEAECRAYAQSMPRPPRVQVPGGIYHLGTRGVRRTRIFESPGDYELFGSILGRVVKRFEWRCHTYCLMPNHYHLLVETPAPNLSAGMQRLNGIYAQWFNELYGVTGHVFERRFYSRLVENSYDLLELVRYVVLNPVRAGLCGDASGWRWSSYNALVGDTLRPSFLTTDWLMSQFGSNPRLSRENVRTFVREAPPRARGT